MQHHVPNMHYLKYNAVSMQYAILHETFFMTIPSLSVDSPDSSQTPV